MASQSSVARLTDNEIDEEIVNEDLQHLGINDDLSNMDLQEKKNLLSAIKASAESSPSVLVTASEKQGNTDTKIGSELPGLSPKVMTHFPDLPKPKTPAKRLPLSTKNYGKRNSFENQSPNIDRLRMQFCLPFCDDDDAPPLIFPEDCPIIMNFKKNTETYGRGYEERERDVRDMIEKYDSWRKSYSEVTGLRELKISQLTKESVNEEDEEEEEKWQKTESVTSLSSTQVEDDIYAFISEESCTVTSKVEVQSPVIENTQKGKSTVKKTTKTTIEEDEQNSPGDDIFKSCPVSPISVSSEEDPMWTSVNTKSRNKQGRNKDTNRNAASTAVEVEMNFSDKWNPQTGSWDSGQAQKYTTRSAKRNQKTISNKNITNNSNEKQMVETKVQCPICQQDFLQSKIENHAAECGIFIPESPHNKSETRVSDNESSNPSSQPGSISQPGPSNQPGPSRQKKNQRGSKRGN